MPETRMPFAEAFDLADPPPPYLFDHGGYVRHRRLAAELERRRLDASLPVEVWKDEGAGEMVFRQGWTPGECG